MINKTHHTLDQVCHVCSDFLMEWTCDKDLFDRVMGKTSSVDQRGATLYGYGDRVCMRCFVSIALKQNRELEPYCRPNKDYLVVTWPLYSISGTGPFTVNFNNMTIQKGEVNAERRFGVLAKVTVS